MKTHQGLKKRYKKTNKKRKKSKLLRQVKGRGSSHLKTKQTNPRKRRIKLTKKAVLNNSLIRAVKGI